MKFNFKSLIFILSLVLNGIFLLLFILGLSANVSRFLFLPPDDNSITSAAIVSFPKNGSASYNCIDIFMSTGDTSFLQFSVFSNNNQSNLLITPLYDRDIIAVYPTGYGLEIKALKEGSTLMQALTNNGILDIALINISDNLP